MASYLRHADGLGSFRVLAVTADTTEISTGGWIALVVLMCIATFLLCGCLYQARKRDLDESLYRVARCGGCRRAFRIPHAIDATTFMCSQCVSEGRRRLSLVEAEERAERLDRMNEAPRSKLRLTKVGSTFFKIKRSDTVKLERQQSTQVCKNLESSLQGAAECKICFDDIPSIVLLPCGHGGLCQGCAKDLIHQSKECYICRGQIELLAELQRPEVPRRDASGTEGRFVGQIIPPAALHHANSRPLEEAVPEVSTGPD